VTFKYPSVQSLQADAATHLTGNPSSKTTGNSNATPEWEVRSSVGLEATCATYAEAKKIGDDLIAQGAQGVKVATRPSPNKNPIDERKHQGKFAPRRPDRKGAAIDRRGTRAYDAGYQWAHRMLYDAGYQWAHRMFPSDGYLDDAIKEGVLVAIDAFREGRVEEGYRILVPELARSPLDIALASATTDGTIVWEVLKGSTTKDVSLTAQEQHDRDVADFSDGFVNGTIDTCERALGLRENPSCGARRNPPEIERGMARAIFIDVFANEYEEHMSPDEREAAGLPRSMSSGLDYDDVAPATPAWAFEAADKLYEKFEELNDKPMAALVSEAEMADRANLINSPTRERRSDIFTEHQGRRWRGQGRTDGYIGISTRQSYLPEAVGEDAYLDSFGHYLAMQAMGHGVSWFDAHAKFPLKFPRIESHQYFDGDLGLASSKKRSKR